MVLVIRNARDTDRRTKHRFHRPSTAQSEARLAHSPAAGATATASSSSVAVAEVAGSDSAASAAAVDHTGRIVPVAGAAVVGGSTHRQVDRASKETGLARSGTAGTSEGEGAVVEEGELGRTRSEERETLLHRTCSAEGVQVRG